MDQPGHSRRQLARTLNSAYADGLLSQDTLDRRLDQVLRDRLIEPGNVVGDLHLRIRHPSPWAWIGSAVHTVIGRMEGLLGPPHPEQLLALDWSGADQELVIGRHPGCEIYLADRTVSRRHARLRFRDGAWIVQDLASTNGTVVNGRKVGRCELRVGDRVRLGDEVLLVD